MPRECAAADCSELLKIGSQYSFHRFPKEKALRTKWRVNMNRIDPKTKRLWEPKPHDVLCSKHFEASSFTSRSTLSQEFGLNYRAQLQPEAVPTLFNHKEVARKRKQEASDRRSAFIKRQRREQMLNQMLTSEEVEVDELEDKETDCSAATAKSNDDQASPSQLLTEISSSRDACLQVQPDTCSVKQQTVSIRIMNAEVQTEPPLQQQQARSPHSSVAAGCSAECQFSSAGCQTDQLQLGFVPQVDESDDDEGKNAGEEKAFLSDDEDWIGPAEEAPMHILMEDLKNCNPFSEKKYIVYEGKLQELLNICRGCSLPCTVVKKGEFGTGVEFSCLCQNKSCGFIYTWRSQPYSFRLPLGNLVLAAAAFFTACSPTRLITACKHANIAIFSNQTYNSLQASYLLPAVRNVWSRCQERLIAARRDRAVKMAGDGRCDSPGHSAKYGSYTLMDAQTSEVIHIELIQSSQVKNSHAMELDGLKKALHKVNGRVHISHLITDRHASVKKYMRDHHSKSHHEQQITHHFDVWHMAKGVTKKIEAVSKSKRNASLSLWRKSISNHMYWCASSSPEGPNRAQLVEDKWVSICNHVADIHEGHGGSYINCQHGQLEKRAWMKKGSRQHGILENIVKNPCLLRDIGKLSPDAQTAVLESYHAVVCHFAPKLNHFTYPVMEAKLHLAAMHFNANAGRQQATTDDGCLQWKIARPRATKGQPVVKAVKEPQTRNYIVELFEEVILLRLTFPTYKKAKSAQHAYTSTIPQPVSKLAEPVDKNDVIAKHRPRIQWKPTSCS